jgi:hypothetical protein
LAEPIAHHAFGEELRNHRGRAVRLVRPRLLGFNNGRLGKHAILCVFSLRRIGAARSGNPVNNA